MKLYYTAKPIKRFYIYLFRGCRECTPQYMCGSQKTTHRASVLSFPLQVLGLTLRLSGLADVGSGHLYLLSHLVNTHSY